jgi:hypothetical protein
VGIEEGNDDGGKGNGDGDGDKEGDGDKPQHSRHWGRKSDGGNNGNGEGDGTKDMAAHTPPGERRMMVVMGHGLCVSFWVSGEMTINKVGPKNCNTTWSYGKAISKGHPH